MANSLNSTLKKLRSGAALQALALLGAGLAGNSLFAASASAQDYTSGAISGTVTNESGEPVADATVTITATSLGFSRTASTSTSGSFRFAGLAAGKYDVVVQSSGAPTYRAEGVTVASSANNDLAISLAAAGGDEIVVQARALAPDFTGTTTGLSVDIAELVKTVPISRDLTSVVLLTPGTSSGDSVFTGGDGQRLPSIGGSSVAENAYYVNGLNITNFDTYVGSARVPFEFYRSIDVKSGGYPAEYGRATGGIVNAVTKSGSNDFTAAVHINWQPDFLRTPGKNLQTCATGGVCTDRTNREFDAQRTENLSTIVEAGGPIIKDRLFVYGLVEFRKSDSYTTNTSGARTALGGTTTRLKSNDPFYAVKVDAYPIDSQHLEFTLFDTRSTTTQTAYTYLEDAGGNASLGAIKTVRENNGGGVNFVGKYTGNFTDWLTLSAAYGRMRDRFDSVGIDANSNGIYVSNLSGGIINGVANNGFLSGQNTASVDSPYTTERKFYRADADVNFNFFGDHHIRGGFDQEDNTLAHNTVRTGGSQLLALNRITEAANAAGNGGAGYIFQVRPGGVVQLNYFNTGGTFDARNRSYYVQDEWKPFDRLTLNLGVRRDDFAVRKPDGDVFLESKGNYAPRLGFTFDLFPEAKGRVFGSYSRYFLPLASNTAFRAAGAEYSFSERFNYSGFDSSGLPILTSQVTGLAAYQTACPINLTGLAISDQNHCTVTGDGSVKDPTYYLSQNLKATRQSEFILGYEQRFRGVKVGISYTHRSLDSTAEDASLDLGIYNYCKSKGLTDCGAQSDLTGSGQFAIINPGEDITIQVDPAFGIPSLANQVITIPAALVGYPKAKRTYDAVTISFDKAWNGVWSLSGNYTWSRTKGNTEGFVQSDFGQDDAGITQDFDFPGFVENSYGYLPTHRAHRFNLFGSVALGENLTLGSNVSVQSPRKLSCFGVNPDDATFGNNYGASASHYCGLKAVNRGDGLETNWLSQVDLSFRYNLKIATGQDVTLRADVFNLTNAQAVQSRNEIGDLDFATAPSTVPTVNPAYGLATNYQTPRSVRLGVDISF